MELMSVKLQKSKGSYFAYLPKIWVKAVGLEKKSKLTWYLNENEHGKLILKISEDETNE
jgi:hypothetical protein